MKLIALFVYVTLKIAALPIFALAIIYGGSWGYRYFLIDGSIITQYLGNGAPWIGAVVGAIAGAMLAAILLGLLSRIYDRDTMN